ncbi:Mobile element protein [Methanosarcina lacustris Z-7289]|uniref:Mobile element protein n=1 Tax=Methanosarcina lacustris Z-7289 TaxID=1434111 RepID=A0A0E3S6X4_9EURY|nr:Mobile element protein [Methanosarcina lacustris Z-7289]
MYIAPIVIAQPSSTHEKSDTFETDFHKMYPTVWLMQLSKKTKFIKRERKIKPDIIFWSLAPGRKLGEKLRKFKDILIQDSTIIRLHDSLANKFPATRARKIAAGVKVGVMISAIANGPKTVALYPENTAEIKTLRIGPWIKDRILLVDLGFYKTQLFARVEGNGGYFVSRIRKNMDPFIVSILTSVVLGAYMLSHKFVMSDDCGLVNLHRI